MQSLGGAKPRARECQAGDGGRKRHELAFFEQQYVDQSVLRSQCAAQAMRPKRFGPSYAAQAMRSNLCGPSYAAQPVRSKLCGPSCALQAVRSKLKSLGSMPLG